MKKLIIAFFIVLTGFSAAVPAQEQLTGGINEDKLLSALKSAVSPDERKAALDKLSDYYLPRNDIGSIVDAYRRTINDANIGKKEKYSYYITIGDIYLAVRQYSSAIEFYQEAVNVLPKLEAARLKLAGVYEQSDLNELAKLTYIDDLKFNKNSFDADFGLASIYMKLGLNTPAMEYFRRAITIKGNSEVYRRTALCAESSGAIAIAIAMLKQIPQEQRVYSDLINLGRLYAESKKFREGEEAFSLAIKMDTENIEGYIYLSLLYLDSNDLKPAENLLNIAIEKVPDEGSLHFFLGCIYSAQKRNDLARQEMQKAGRLAKTDVLKKYSSKFEIFLSNQH